METVATIVYARLRNVLPVCNAMPSQFSAPLADELRGVLESAISRQNGVIAQQRADSVLAVFANTRDETPDHARRALHAAVLAVYDAIGENFAPDVRAQEICGNFREDIQLNFAQDLGFTNCAAAVEGLHKQVTNVNDYVESVTPRTYDTAQTTLTISSCDFTISGGPALGVFTVTKVENNQWLITGHVPGPAKCPAPTSTTG